MHYMLDTNTCIYVIKHRPAEVKKKLSAIPLDKMALSSVVIGELWYGVFESTKQKNNEKALNDFLQFVTVRDWPVEAAQTYGSIRSYLKKKGTPIGAMDLLIAAHALTVGSILVTDNVTEFKRVPGLRVENWVMR
ncbi:MAG: type II toxin-antitoxin system tRNA(fMet)-specific endonuclease VapC [Gammaproteobacteria bacterium]